MRLARQGGADAVLVTCSSIGPSVPMARKLVDFPVFRIDEAMAAAPVRQASRIGVAATLDEGAELRVLVVMAKR